MLKRDMNIADFDPELWQAITQETDRQEAHIELIVIGIVLVTTLPVLFKLLKKRVIKKSKLRCRYFI